MVYFRLNRLLKEELSKEKKKPEGTHLTLTAKQTLKPFPETVNREYGWVCTKEDFKLERWGRDNWTTPPLPPDD